MENSREGKTRGTLGDQETAEFLHLIAHSADGRNDPIWTMPKPEGWGFIRVFPRRTRVTDIWTLSEDFPKPPADSWIGSRYSPAPI